MASLASPIVRDDRLLRDDVRTVEASLSAVSWPAIIAGAFAAAAISLVLVALGAGWGLASVSPWSNSVSATTFTVMTGIWFVVIQWLASALGGYVTGRLRTKWVNTHTHEVFFRDTLHGFLAWAVATVATAGLLSTAVSSLAAGGAQIAGQAAVVASANVAANTTNSSYDVDMLFRSARTDMTASLSDARAEALRILAQGLVTGDVPAADHDYLVSLVAARTGVTPAEAQARVDNRIAEVKAANVKAREAADAARKASVTFSILTALSMLIGAFIASTAAALGGRQRDEHP